MQGTDHVIIRECEKHGGEGDAEEQRKALRMYPQ